MVRVELVEAATTRIPVTVVTVAGHLDADLLPHFLKHYRSLGVSGFVVALHGAFHQDMVEALASEPDVCIFSEFRGLFSEATRIEKISWMLQTLIGQWVITCDVDELLETPAETLQQTIEIMDRLGMQAMPALLLQRMTGDGSLPVVEANDDLQQLFPLYSYNLSEQLSPSHPPIKTKHPLIKVGADFVVRAGSHSPACGGSVSQMPVRGMLGHFKWRKMLLESSKQFRAEDANPREMNAYNQYLSKNPNVLPLTGSRPYSREDMIRRGFLVCPDDDQVRKAITVKTAPEAPSLEDMPVCDGVREIVRAQSPGARKLKICFVTREFNGPFGAGGVGTATTATAEMLAAAGHDVDVVFVPYHRHDVLDWFWTGFFAARGIKLHQFSLMGLSGGGLSLGKIRRKVKEVVVANKYDVVHIDDAHAIGVHLCQLRRSGLELRSTAVVMTTHGCSYWHAYKGNMPIENTMAEFHHGFEQQNFLADLTIHPSRYMQDWVNANVGPPRRDVAIANIMNGFCRSFGHLDTGCKTSTEVVFFGRIEPRKGYDVFRDAVLALQERGEIVAKITLLGRIGESLNRDRVVAEIKTISDSVKVLDNLHNMEAVNYLKANDCFVVIPSLRDNLPYTIYECLENGIPMICSNVGGVPELIDERDHERTMVANDPAQIADAIVTALKHGWTPARLAFDPDVVAIQQLSAFGWLGQQAMLQDEASVPVQNQVRGIFFGEAGQTPSVAVKSGIDMIAATGCDDIERIGVDSFHNRQAVAAINAAIMGTDKEFVLLCHDSVQILSQQTVPAMVRLLAGSPFDAVVCDYYVMAQSAEGTIFGVTGTIDAPGGPSPRAPSHNVFGAGISVIRVSALRRIGGVDPDSTRAGTLVWEVLNKLCAQGGKVTSIPEALVRKTVSGIDELEHFGDRQLHERLRRHWVAGLGLQHENIVSSAIYEAFRKCPYTDQALDVFRQTTLEARGSDAATGAAK